MWPCFETIIYNMSIQDVRATVMTHYKDVPRVNGKLCMYTVYVSNIVHTCTWTFLILIYIYTCMCIVECIHPVHSLCIAALILCCSMTCPLCQRNELYITQ